MAEEGDLHEKHVELKMRVDQLVHDHRGMAELLERISKTLKEVSDFAHETRHSLDSWIRTANVVTAAIMLVGGAFIALFAWVLAEKNADIRALQQTAVSNQITITQMLEQQKGVQSELSRQSKVDVETVKSMLEVLKHSSEIPKPRK